MFANCFPNFNKGRILKKEMLENLRDFPRHFVDLYFGDFSGGVISGADVIVGENTLTVNKGILKHHHTIYLLESDYLMPYFNTNKEMMIKVRFLNEAAEADFVLNPTDILLDDNMMIASNEMELGRFKLREGAQLRSDYTDFFDLATEYNTINMIYVPYAGWPVATLNPMILRFFAKNVLKCRTENGYDIHFAMQCLNRGVVERETILYYLSNREGLPYQDYSNLEIYRHLTFIVKEVQSGIKRNIAVEARKTERIVID